MKLIAYKTFIRPKLEYTDLIRWPHQIYLINILEGTQNKVARFISQNSSQRSSVTPIKHHFLLTSLTNRNMIGRPVFFYNAYYNELPERKAYITTLIFIYLFKYLRGPYGHYTGGEHYNVMLTKRKCTLQKLAQ